MGDPVCQESFCLPGNGQCALVSRTCDDGNPCTRDSCDSVLGCVYEPITCAPTTECDFPTGCIGTGPEPECIYQNITSLFDFCGTCRGNNADCFFQSALGNEAIIGISAGVAVGITAAVICGVAIALYLSKKI